MNWFRKPKQTVQTVPELTTSNIYDEDTFYRNFIHDLHNANEEVVIESPFITVNRIRILKPTFEKLMNKGVKVFIITKDPNEQENSMAEQSEAGICFFETIGIEVLLIKGGHHRKLAMIDRKIIWEGSLNILSQSRSREFMRRIESRKLTEELFKFLHFDRLTEFSNF